MREFRLKALEHFRRARRPKWGGNLGQIDFENIHYFVRASEKNSRSWDEVPDDIKNTFDRLGIPEAERKFLSGVGAQYESEVVYHQVREDLEKQGVIFTDMDTALREHEDIVREYWATVIPPNDNKLAALNSAVWSGGSFVYVPPGVKVDMPLQAYFRINTENMGQFERTLIIAEEGSDVHYVEGCTAPVYSTDSLHSAVVEIIAKPGAQGPLHDRPELVAQRLQPGHQARRRAGGRDDGVDRLQPGLEADHEVPVDLPARPRGPRRDPLDRVRRPGPAPGRRRARSSTARRRRPRRSSPSRSPRTAAGARYRGLLEIAKGATEARSKVVCDALLLDEDSRSDTYPTIRIDENDANVGHEASVSKIGEEQLFYLQAHGLDEEEASKMIVNGFIEPITKELPMEYAVEMNRLIELQMEGSIG